MTLAQKEEMEDVKDAASPLKTETAESGGHTGLGTWTSQPGKGHAHGPHGHKATRPPGFRRDTSHPSRAE